MLDYALKYELVGKTMPEPSVFSNDIILPFLDLGNIVSKNATIHKNHGVFLSL